MNLRQKFAESVRGYLESTTIHGFSYLGASKSVIERVAWVLIIGTCFALAWTLIVKNIKDANENPVLTTFENVPVKEVPFPSITIDGGDTDPWEPSAKALNNLAFDSYDTVRNGDFENSEALKKIFTPVIDEVFNMMKNHHRLQNKDSEQVLTEFAPKLPMWVDTLSFVLANDPTEGKRLETNLENGAKTALFTKDKSDPFFPFREIDEINLQDVLGDKNVTFEHVERAQNVVHFALKILKLNINKQPVGFGHFLDYVIHAITKGMPYAYSQLYSTISPAEILTDEFLTNYSFVETSTKERYNTKDMATWVSNLGGYLWGNSFHCPSFSFPVYRCHIMIDNFNEHKNCCQLMTFQSFEKGKLMQLMHDSLQPIRYFKDEDEMNYVQNLSSNIPFTKSKSYRAELNHDARLFACKYNDKKMKTFDRMMKNCKMFHRDITMNGIGITFNSADHWTKYKETDYMNNFAEIFKPKGYSSYPIQEEQNTNQFKIYEGKNILNLEKSGAQNGLLFFLQAKWKYGGAPTKPFMLSLQDPRFIPSLSETGIEIEQGKFTTISVVQKQIITSNDLEGNSEIERGCRFNFERSSKVFKEYHQNGCIFECLLEHAYKEFNCTPWDYPHIDKSHQLCNYWARKAMFEVEMSLTDSKLVNSSHSHPCIEKCPTECTKTLYTPFVSTTHLDLSEICVSNENLFAKAGSTIKHNTRPLGTIKLMEHMLFGKNISDYEMCKEKMKRFAVVRIELASNTVTRITRTKRVTITDHIANIGKSLFLLSSSFSFT